MIAKNSLFIWNNKLYRWYADRTNIIKYETNLFVRTCQRKSNNIYKAVLNSVDLHYEKEFILFAITADYYDKKDKFKSIPKQYRSYIKWINWQSVPFVLEKILETHTEIKSEEINFASDLCQLLDKKCLRSFHGITYSGVSLENYNSIFFDARTAKLRGDFIGFLESLSSIKNIKPKPQIVFYDNRKKMFKPLFELKKMDITKIPIFFKEGTKNE